MRSVNQLKVQRQEGERGEESGSARGRTERDFCTIDLHPIDKLENAPLQSEKMKSYYERESMHVKYLQRYANILFFLSTQRTSYLIFPSFIWPFEKRALLCYGNGVRC